MILCIDFGTLQAKNHTTFLMQPNGAVARIFLVHWCIYC